MTPDLIAGRYRVQRSLGRGAMGTVWLCFDEVLGRQVAVKQLGPLAHEEVPVRERALREGRAAAALNHPNVVPVFDVVDDGAAPWLVMEYVPSRTLADIIEADGPLPPDRVAHLGSQVAAGLMAAHALGIIHRDIKPANVLVTEDDVAKVTDFGIARNLTDDRLTATGLVPGTPAYLSPELARGGDPSPASDVWALGVTVYAAVEGEPPYPRRTNALAVLQMIASEPPPRPQHAGPLTETITRMMEPDPAWRWEMADAERELRRLADGGHWAPSAVAETRVAPAPFPETQPAPPPVSGTPSAPPPPPSRERSRRGPVLAAVALALLVVLGTTGYLLSTAPGEEETPAAPPSPDPSPSGESSPSTDSSPTPSQPSTEASPAPSPDQAPEEAQIAAVESYFASLPSDTDAGWTRLAPAMQREVGRDSYESWWGSIESVRAEGTTAVDGEPAVTTQLTYSFKDGRVAVEEQRISLQKSGDGYLIADDQVLSSRTVSN